MSTRRDLVVTIVVGVIVFAALFLGSMVVFMNLGAGMPWALGMAAGVTVLVPLWLADDAGWLDES